MIMKTLLKKKYLRRISGVKHEKFEKCVSKLKRAWRAAQKRKRVAGRPYGIWGLTGAFAVVVDVLSDVYNTFVFGANI